MPRGPGRYDSETTMIRTRTGAEAVVLIVLGGDRGTGFSVQVPEGFALDLASVLDEVARNIRTGIGH